jgi:hypothetical protein
LESEEDSSSSSNDYCSKGSDEKIMDEVDDIFDNVRENADFEINLSKSQHS